MPARKNLAIIPARGGSKGLPNKNINSIAGKPLIAWSIEQAIASAGIDRVLVSTDSQDIAEIARSYGAEAPFIRPAAFATDTATTESAMMHAIEWLDYKESYKPDNVILLQATSPIRYKNAIDNALEEFTTHKADSLLSTCEFWHFLWQDRHAPSALYDFKNRPRRQDISQENLKFKENGSIYITNREVLMSFKNRLGGSVAMYVMSDEESIEIDTQLDWMLAETILINSKGRM
jgi:N-acylneuraminate cytidylyltransferase